MHKNKCEKDSVSKTEEKKFKGRKKIEIGVREL